MNCKLSLFALGAIVGVMCCSSASAVTVPFTENFSANDADWKNPASTAPTYVATGGPLGAGDAYISASRSLSTSPQGQTVFRANDNFNASGGAFVGDWITAGVTAFSFWFRHNHTSPLDIGTRFAITDNFPAFATDTAVIAPLGIAPNVWTLISFDIDPSNPDLVGEGSGPGSSFAEIFDSIGKLQISAASPGVATGAITFDLDAVSLTPEPTGVVLGFLAAAAVWSVSRRRRRLR